MPERSGPIVNMNRLDTARRAAIVATLVEGNSIRATVRMTGAAKNTVVKLRVDLGAACDRLAALAPRAQEASTLKQHALRLMEMLV